MRKLWLVMMLAMLGCGKTEAPVAEAPRSEVPAAKPPATDMRPVIVCFGDSITAGFGLEPGQGYVDLLQQDLDRRGLKYRVVNMGVSGDTTQDGLGRVGLAVAEKPAAVVLELGGNDGLRGLPVAVTKQNLAEMIEAFQKGGARVVLAGMTLPPNYGPAYIARFEGIYRELAEQYRVTLIPLLFNGMEGYMQRDGIHPNAEGAKRVEAVVLKALALK